ncbi:PE-PGRS family protein [Dyadobacter luticola]|uniref:PE-PGRS family protein n=1 Tax=Dyadobacter luticola TaxID=1979387 RepID=A0A5R9KXC4_9BACT|nr:PE-PGRS family protein [Dyadobacter luticola]TLV00788.1 PE-PGRS family protein [Dyadobacter luticola]
MDVYKRLGGQFGIIFASLLFCVTCSCDPDPDPDSGVSDNFETVPVKNNVTPGIIDEASGLAPSISFPGYLWTNQDSGNPNSIYLISGDAKNIKEYQLPGSSNHDWEDIAAGPGPSSGVNYLYVADIGNNISPMTASNTIYRVPEIKSQDASFSQESVEKIVFTYPDGPRDAESVLVDPVTKDIFIISKSAQNTGIYRLAFPQNVSSSTIAEKVGEVPSVSVATSADISGNGSEILIRTYLSVYYWKRKAGEMVGQTLSQPAAKQLNVALEPQGEGICFDKDGTGFYTISEKSNSGGVSLNFYKRK